MRNRYRDTTIFEPSLHEAALYQSVAAVLNEHYDDGPIPAGYPGLSDHGPGVNRPLCEDDRYSRPYGARSPLATLRMRLVAEQVRNVLVYAGPFTHDPERDTTPEVDREAFHQALRSRLTFRHHRFVDEDELTEPLLGPLVEGRNPDDFAEAVNVNRVVREIVDTIADDIERGEIEVEFTEPWDSCSGCGGYHNVNYLCDDENRD